MHKPLQFVPFPPLSTADKVADGLQAILMAAIQIQISSSLWIESAHLYTAASALFTVGIILDVVGASYALASASQLDANFVGAKSFIRGLSEEELEEISHLPLSPSAKKLARQITLHPVERRPSADGIAGDRLFRKTSLEKYSRSIEHNKTAAYLASATIALGFLSFLAGFLCFLQGTQPTAVLIAAYTVVGVLIFLRFLVIPLQDRLQSLVRRRTVP